MKEISPNDYQIYLFHDGSYFRSYELFGAKLVSEEGRKGVSFTVWAPHVKEVQVVGDFNEWNGTNFVMNKMNNEGIWHLFIPNLKEGEKYKYKIMTATNDILLKSDPYAYHSEVRPNTASIVYQMDNYKWGDQKWRREQKKKNTFKEPMNIYEVHLGSWKKKDIAILEKAKNYEENDVNSFYTYRELVDELIPYVKEHKFTHIEIMPLVEYPYDRSWGYQGTGYYSVTSRYGTAHDFMYFVDKCHQNGIGVLIDWVPGHFCKDAHGLYMFSGEPTYEYKNMPVRENAVWGTANFDIGKKEVQSFLISNALFWLEYFHVDGFRMDAVANMLYWGSDGGKEKNHLAVAFFQKLNQAISINYPEAIICAEDSTDWPLVTAPPSDGGLGFHYKWNMGWMNDMLTYMECEPYQRKYIHNKMTFSMLYAFSDNYILPLSHDEVVHGKKSLLNKMPGDYWQKFAQLRLLYGYMYAHPGKKLLFMGGEFGQFDEWKDMEQLDFMLHDYEMHKKMNEFTKALFSLYKRTKPLWQLDHTHEGFEWIDADNHGQSIFSFIRKGEDANDFVVIVCNFTPETYHHFKVGVPKQETYREVLNSDDIAFGGSGKVNKKPLKTLSEISHHQPATIEITVPPLAVTILKPVKKRKVASENA